MVNPTFTCPRHILCFLLMSNVDFKGDPQPIPTPTTQPQLPPPPPTHAVRHPFLTFWRNNWLNYDCLSLFARLSTNYGKRNPTSTWPSTQLRQSISKKRYIGYYWMFRYNVLSLFKSLVRCSCAQHMLIFYNICQHRNNFALVIRVGLCLSCSLFPVYGWVPHVVPFSHHRAACHVA